MSMLINSRLLQIISGALLMAGALQADISPDANIHIQAGSRQIPAEEKQRLYERRDQLKKQAAQNGYTEEDQEGGMPRCMQAIEIVSSGVSEEVGGIAAKSQTMQHAAYYTTHEGAIHRAIAVSPLGDSIELEDGSIWTIRSGDRDKILNWLASDTIIILPNHAWFSTYEYRLVNQNTGASIQVNLFFPPIYNGLYTHWIVAIDYQNRKICLEDGSVWRISFWDSSILNYWLINDTIIIGINDGWLSGSNPNMLINVNVNTDATGKCLY